jgi:hypothetical protein
MWSVALLCNGGTRSIVARSLAQHRCQELCSFRIITRVGVHADLRVLLLAREHTSRCIAQPAVLHLHKIVEEYLKGFSSAAGWSASAWVGHTVWEIAESETAVEHSNLLKLEQWLEEIGEPLFSDERRELYNRILARVYIASALPHHAAAQKKFTHGSYEDWVKTEVHRIRGNAPTRAGATLTGKMQKANIPDSAIQNALKMRLAYRGKMLTPRYLQEEEYKTAELELTAKLQHLVAHLDVGSLNMSGPEFHAKCLDAAGELHERFRRVELSFLHGSMYTMTDRCRHRFLRAPLP